MVNYTVRSGDTITRIAKQFSATVEAIVALNHIKNPNLIYVGQVLIIPDAVGLPLTPPLPSVKKGLAMAVTNGDDLVKLGVRWCYTWGWQNGQIGEVWYIPMLRNMESPREKNVPTILFGNEPNAIEPFGHPITPKEAALATLAVQRDNPHTKLVVGGVAADDWRTAGGWGSGYNWLRAFLSEYRKASGRKFSQALACHVYTQDSAAWAIARLREYRSLYSGEMWLTEFGVLSGNAASFKAVIDYAWGRFSRIAPYTNRQPGSCGGERQGWEIGKGVDLVNCADGQLTAAGKEWAKR